MFKAGWGAALRGEIGDLADWADALPHDFEPWIERHDAEFILRSAVFDRVGSSEELENTAALLIGRLLGAFALQGVQPVHFDSAILVDADGRRSRFVSVSGMIQGRARLRANATVADASGRELPPEPSSVQLWSNLAANNDILDEALVHFGRSDGWFDTYKALECIEDLAGGERALQALNLAPRSQLKLLKRTANFYRHAREMRPEVPMEIGAARELLAKLLRAHLV